MKQLNQGVRAEQLVIALDGLGGDLATTLRLAEAMKPSQWADLAVYKADITPPSDETIAITIGILRTRVRAEQERIRKGQTNDPFACFPKTEPTLGVVR